MTKEVQPKPIKSNKKAELAKRQKQLTQALKQNLKRRKKEKDS